MAESRVSKLNRLRGRTVFEAGSGTRPELLSVNWLPHQDSNLDHRVNSPGSCQLNDTGTKIGLPYGNRTRLVPVNSRLLSQRSIRARLVHPEGIEPSSPPCHGGVLPLNDGRSTGAAGGNRTRTPRLGTWETTTILRTQRFSQHQAATPVRSGRPALCYPTFVWWLEKW